MNDTTPEQTKQSWWRRLSSGLKRTSSSLGTAVAALDQRPIGLGNLAMLEQQPERGRRLAMAPQDEATGRILVEPVGEDRWPWQPEAQCIEGGFEVGAALGAAMYR